MCLMVVVSSEINVTPPVLQISRVQTGQFKESWSAHRVGLTDHSDTQRSAPLGSPAYDAARRPRQPQLFELSPHS